MKTFDRYVDEYASCNKVGFNYSQFEHIPYLKFEEALGLFKFICDDIDLDWYKALTNLKLGIPRKTKLHDILPKGFINQIIEL